jgi:ApaG protein
MLATSFGIRKKLLDRAFVLTFERVLKLLQIFDKYPQHAHEVLSVRQRNIAPHFRRTRGDAGGIAKSSGANQRLLLGMYRAQNVIGKFGGDDMRQMAGAADQVVVQFRAHPKGLRADRFPKILHGANRVSVRPLRWRDQANGVVEQVGPRSFHASFFRARHRMTSDKMTADASENGFEFANGNFFHTADVCDDSAGFQMRPHFFAELAHLAKRRANDYERRAGNSFGQILRSVGGGSDFETFGNRFSTANVSMDRCSNFPLPNRHTQRPAQKAGADDGDFFRLHAFRIRSWRKKSRTAQFVAWRQGVATVACSVSSPQDFLEPEGLRVTVDRVVYNPSFEAPEDRPHCFVYFISIHNDTDVPVTIKLRKWVVTNERGDVCAYEGDGVVGQFPVINPGAKFSYNSFHLLDTNSAVAEGSYLGIDDQGHRVLTRIPRFKMVVPT